VLVGVVVCVIAQQPGLLAPAPTAGGSTTSFTETLFMTTTASPPPTTAPIGIATRLTTAGSIALLLVLAAVCGALAVFAHVGRNRYERLAKVALCVSSATSGGITVVFTKALATMIVFGTHIGDTKLTIFSWQGGVISAIFLVSLLVQLRLINDSLKCNEILFHVNNKKFSFRNYSLILLQTPVFFVILQLLSVIVGVVVFDELRALTPLQTALFVAGSFVLVGGVALSALRVFRFGRATSSSTTTTRGDDDSTKPIISARDSM
jgi:hypothetical protein